MVEHGLAHGEVVDEDLPGVEGLPADEVGVGLEALLRDGKERVEGRRPPTDVDGRAQDPDNGLPGPQAVHVAPADPGEHPSVKNQKPKMSACPISRFCSGEFRDCLFSRFLCSISSFYL